jgi:hypothetical protein
MGGVSAGRDGAPARQEEVDVEVGRQQHRPIRTTVKESWL